jgi:hypothetical protein
MNRRTQGALLVGGLAVATVLMLAVALGRGLDDHHCQTGFLRFISCDTSWSWTSQTQWNTRIPSIPATSKVSHLTSHHSYLSGYVDATSWAVTTHCPQDDFHKGLPCADASVAVPAQAASDDLEVQLSETTGLPLPKRQVLTTAQKSPFITSVHVETPLDLAAVLSFYRIELSKRGWTENEGAVVAPDRAEIAFTTTDGPALLRLIHQGDRTIADLSLRKPATATGDIQPRPGQVRLMLGNETGEEAVITINEQIVKLAARAGLPDSPEIDLPPGKFKVTLKVASGAAEDREFEVAADETWGLLVGPAGIPLPVHLY